MPARLAYGELDGRPAPHVDIGQTAGELIFDIITAELTDKAQETGVACFETAAQTSLERSVSRTLTEVPKVEVQSPQSKHAIKVQGVRAATARIAVSHRPHSAYLLR